MEQFSSEIGFILLVALVLIGILIYAYVTVMNKGKASSSVPDSGKPPSRYKTVSNFNEFVDLTRSNQPGELSITPVELAEALPGLENSLTAAGVSTQQALDAIDANLVAECTQCRTRFSAKAIRKLDSGKCPTPQCSSERYTLRWMAAPKEDQMGEAYKEL